MVEGDSAGWTLGVKIGFYYDLQIKAASRQIGLGLSPPGFSADAIEPFGQ